ncbi:LysE family translocator [Vibrio sp. WJH972]
MTLYQSIGLILSIQTVALLIPGQNHMLLMTTVSYSKWYRAFTLFGIASAGTTFAVLIAMSISIAENQFSETLFLALSALGCCYLIYLGLTLFRASLISRANASSRVFSQKLLSKHPFAVGYLINISNPKTMLFFSSIFMTTLPVTTTSLLDFAFVIILIFLNSLLMHGIIATVFSLPLIKPWILRNQTKIGLGAALIFTCFGFMNAWRIIHLL